MDKDDSVNTPVACYELSNHELLGLIREAVDSDGFVLCAEPIVDVATGEPIKQELTLLLPAPDGGLIPASGLHAVAERFGLTTELDDQLIRSAAALARDGEAVAIDVQPGSVSDPDLARRTELALADAGAAPGLITLELSEESLTANAPAAAAFAQRMHDMGCSITGDRFGTGTAGFGYLKRLPLDCLKIDACFIEGLRSNPGDEQFVRAFVQLARGLGLATAADGVLDEPTRVVLEDAGVDQAQGALFGDPVTLTYDRRAALCSSSRAAPAAR
jgi:EAL domain-containing protein (putative c-di-GMP-specific phosphodiesterase class I)